MMTNISTLWIGNPLSLAHQIALSSFVYYGHNIKIYLYDQSIEVPAGVIKADANDILKESEIFTHYGSYAAFSDVFRYVMIQKTGEAWVDTDVICLSESFLADKEYAFLEESDGIYNGAILKLPKDSPALLWLTKKALKIGKSQAVIGKRYETEGFSWDSWVYVGPGLVTKAANLFGLKDFASSHQSFAMCNIHEESPEDIFWNPEYLDEFLKRVPYASSATFFNSWLDQRGIDRNAIPVGSGMEYMYKKFIETPLSPFGS